MRILLSYSIFTWLKQQQTGSRPIGYQCTVNIYLCKLRSGVTWWMYLHPLTKETLSAHFTSASDLIWGNVDPPLEAGSEIKHRGAGNNFSLLASVCNILLFKVSLTHWNGFYTPPQVSLLVRVGRFPGVRLNYDSLCCWLLVSRN